MTSTEQVERVARALFAEAQAEAEAEARKVGRGVPLPSYDDDDEDSRQFCIRLARAAIAAVGDEWRTAALNMRLALDTALKHKFETQSHGGLTEFGEGGLAALRSLEREFDRIRPLPKAPDVTEKEKG